MAVNFKRNFFLSFFVVVLFCCAALIYALSKMSTDEVVLCSSGSDSFYINNHICEHYMRLFRDSPADVEALSYGGVEVILNLQGDKKYEIADFYIAKGLNVNLINQYQSQFGTDFTPLHSAVFDNDLQKVNFLINHNANLTLTSKSAGNLTPLQYALYLQEESSEIDRSAIIALLNKAL